MNARALRCDLQLIHPFGISRGTMTTCPVFFLEFEGGGLGEGSPVRYKNQDADEGARLALEMANGVTDENLFDFDFHTRRAYEIAPEHSSARAAFDIALHDRIAKRLDVPLYQLFGYSDGSGMPSSFTIALDTDEKMVAKTHEAADFPCLKVKLGRDDAERDLATLCQIRTAAPDKIIRVDANAGWSFETARRCVRGAADLGIEFIEAPLAIGNLEQLERLRQESPLPLIADEDVQGLASLPDLLGKVDGINIKLMKCGGLWEARQMIAFARAVGWQVMFGCMIESSVGIAAAAQLAGTAQSLDLDSEWLVSNNPCGPDPILASDGRIALSSRSGHGICLTLP